MTTGQVLPFSSQCVVPPALGISSLELSSQGGTFLYVATVLQPVSHHLEVPSAGDMRPLTRVVFISLGMFTPFLLSTFLGHGH